MEQRLLIAPTASTQIFALSFLKGPLDGGLARGESLRSRGSWAAAAAESACFGPSCSGPIGEFGIFSRA